MTLSRQRRGLQLFAPQSSSFSALETLILGLRYQQDYESSSSTVPEDNPRTPSKPTMSSTALKASTVMIAPHFRSSRYSMCCASNPHWKHVCRNQERRVIGANSQEKLREAKIIIKPAVRGCALFVLIPAHIA